jgi:hypothetical protein
MSDYLFYIQSFCRFTIIIMFSISFIGKAQNLQQSEQAIINFDLIPRSLARMATYSLLISEIIVVVLLLLGGTWLGLGFALTIVQLVVFSAALASVLKRKIQTPCNCFGSSEKLVSGYDLVRNGGFIICALVGLVSLGMESSMDLSLIETGLMAVMAIPVVIIWINLGDLVQLFD